MKFWSRIAGTKKLLVRYLVGIKCSMLYVLILCTAYKVDNKYKRRIQVYFYTHVRENVGSNL